MASIVEYSVRDGASAKEVLARIFISKDGLPRFRIHDDDIWPFSNDDNAGNDHDRAEDGSIGHAVLPDEGTRCGVDGVQAASARLSIDDSFMAADVERGAIPGAGRLATTTIEQPTESSITAPYE